MRKVLLTALPANSFEILITMHCIRTVGVKMSVKIREKYVEKNIHRNCLRMICSTFLELLLSTMLCLLSIYIVFQLKFQFVNFSYDSLCTCLTEKLLRERERESMPGFNLIIINCALYNH